MDKSAEHLLVLGLGCERGTSAGEVILLAEQVLAASGFSARQLSLVCSLEQRAEEPAILAAASHFSVPLRVFDAGTLEKETPRLANPSSVVFAHTGCHGVAEAAAFAGAGEESVLIVPKTKSAHATAAVAVLVKAKAISEFDDFYQDVVTVFEKTESASSCDDSSRFREVAR